MFSPLFDLLSPFITGNNSLSKKYLYEKPHEDEPLIVPLKHRTEFRLIYRMISNEKIRCLMHCQVESPALFRKLFILLFD